MKTLTQEDIYTPMFTLWRCPWTDDWVKKSAINKNEILSFATAWINLKSIMLSEIDQINKNTILSLLCVESKNKTKQSNKIKMEVTETRLMVCQRQGIGNKIMGEKLNPQL